MKRFYWITDANDCVVFHGGKDAARRYYKRKGGKDAGLRCFNVLRKSERPNLGPLPKYLDDADMGALAAALALTV